MRRIICIALASMLMLCPATVHAEEMERNVVAGSIQPRYAYTVSANSNLAISAGKATCKSDADGLSGVTKIVATQYLEKRYCFGGAKWIHGARQVLQVRLA